VALTVVQRNTQFVSFADFLREDIVYRSGSPQHFIYAVTGPDAAKYILHFEGVDLDTPNARIQRIALYELDPAAQGQIGDIVASLTLSAGTTTAVGPLDAFAKGGLEQVCFLRNLVFGRGQI
jgi:hypothetical protein